MALGWGETIGVVYIVLSKNTKDKAGTFVERESEKLFDAPGSGFHCWIC